MSGLVTREVDFAEVARSEPAQVTAQYQADGIVALVMPLEASPLTTVLTLPPKGCSFGIDWWLGESYSDWSLMSGLDRSLVQAVVEALSQHRLSLKKIPLNLVSLRGLFDEERASRATTWNPRSFQAITVPSAAANDALEALRAAYQPVQDYLVKGQGSARRLDTARHGEVLLERAFSIGFAGSNFFLGHSYRHGADASRIRDMLPVPSEREQQGLLAETIQDIEKASKTEPAELVREVFYRQHLYMLDAREFAPALTAEVARINRQRTELLRSLSCPHFYFHLCVGLLDTSKNAPQKRYRRIKSDQDWLDWLRKESKASLSKDSAEVENVAVYVENVRAKYPCYSEDPMRVLRT